MQDLIKAHRRLNQLLVSKLHPNKVGQEGWRPPFLWIRQISSNSLQCEEVIVQVLLSDFKQANWRKWNLTNLKAERSHQVMVTLKISKIRTRWLITPHTCINRLSHSVWARLHHRRLLQGAKMNHPEAKRCFWTITHSLERQAPQSTVQVRPILSTCSPNQLYILSLRLCKLGIKISCKFIRLQLKKTSNLNHWKLSRILKLPFFLKYKVKYRIKDNWFKSYKVISWLHQTSRPSNITPCRLHSRKIAPDLWIEYWIQTSSSNLLQPRVEEPPQRKETKLAKKLDLQRPERGIHRISIETPGEALRFRTRRFKRSSSLISHWRLLARRIWMMKDNLLIRPSLQKFKTRLIKTTLWYKIYSTANITQSKNGKEKNKIRSRCRKNFYQDILQNLKNTAWSAE